MAWVREGTVPTERPRMSANLVPTFADRGCRVVSATDPYRRNLGFIDCSRYHFFQVGPQLYSRGWVGPVPDPLLLKKSGSAGNRNPVHTAPSYFCYPPTYVSFLPSFQLKFSVYSSSSSCGLHILSNSSALSYRSYLWKNAIYESPSHLVSSILFHFVFLHGMLWNSNSMVWVRERTIPTERPPLVGEVIANFCG
jgi:hypothetical protein